MLFYIIRMFLPSNGDNSDDSNDATQGSSKASKLAEVLADFIVRGYKKLHTKCRQCEVRNSKSH